MKNYKKYFIIPSEPELVYKALSLEKTIQLWSGLETQFEKEVGGEFSIWNGDINGINLHFEENKEIAQQWFLQEIEKAEDASIVSLKFFPDKKGCSLLVEQSNIPDALFDEISEFWTDKFMLQLINFYTE